MALLKRILFLLLVSSLINSVQGITDKGYNSAVWASSDYDAAHTASKAIDRNNTTFWAPLAFNGSIGIDLGKNYSIHYISIYSVAYTVIPLYVNGSYDNVSWTQIYYNSSFNLSETKNININSDYRYLNISSLTSGQLLINEIYVYVDEPQLITPQDNETLSKNYPPLTDLILFEWSYDMSGWSSNLIIAKDINFNVIVVDTTTTNNYSTQALEAEDYWWKVRYYNATSGTYYNWSNISYFTLTNDITSEGTGIDGIVYELIDGVRTPLSGVTVYIANTTHTDSMMTGSNGYFLFDSLANDTYSVIAKTTGYDDSQTELITVNGSIVTKDIRMNKCKSSFTCNYDSKYVKFYVVDIWTKSYKNIAVTAYKGSDVLASHTGTTGSDGGITFFMVKDQSYRMTFVNASQSINLERTITIGEENEIYVLVSVDSGNWWNNQSYSESGVINFIVSTSEINATHAFINATYNDTLASSTWKVYLNQTNHTNGTQPQINLQSTTGSNNGTISFLVSGYKGQSYLMNLDATHTTFGNVKRSFGIGFTGLQSTSLDFISNLFKALIAIAIIIFVGSMFGYDSRNQGALVVCALGWIFLGIGFFAYFNTTGMAAGLLIATVFAVFMNMNERARQEDMT